MAKASIYDQILDYACRPGPYPLRELRQTPTTRQADGSYVVSTYDEIVALLHDPCPARGSALHHRPTRSSWPLTRTRERRPAAGTAGVPDHSVGNPHATVAVPGHDPSERRAELIHHH
jgi:hypothetical protein